MAFLCGVGRGFRGDVGEYHQHWDNERLDAENRLWLIRLIPILLWGFVFSKMPNGIGVKFWCENGTWKLCSFF